MLAKSTIYKGSVYICSSRNREHIRIPVGIKAEKLNANGLLNKASGVAEIESGNSRIKEKLKAVQDALDSFPHFTAKEISDYVKKGILPQARVEVRRLSFLECFEQFIKVSKFGERLTDKGTVYAPNTIKSYQSVLTNLKLFKDVYPLEWNSIDMSFYNKFCEFYWEKLGSYDNNTGKAVKIVITMLNWAYDTGLIPNKINTKNWKVWKEDIEILVLYADEINLLHKMPLSNEKLTRTRDIFLMGTFTCLRVENLLSLNEKDLLVIGKEYYINTLVQKTKKIIRIKCNPIGVDIIQKYRNKYHTLLPSISSVKFNENLKELAAEFKTYLNDLKTENGELDIVANNWNKDFKRIRTKKGVHHYEFVCPTKFISSHAMRRSGISALLSMGLSPYEVQQISGHSLNSKDFTKYVKIANQVVENKSVNAWSHALAN